MNMEQMGVRGSEQPLSQAHKIEQEIEDLKNQIKQLEQNPAYSVRVDKVNAQGEHTKFSSKQNQEEQIVTLEQKIRELEIQKNVLEIEEPSKSLEPVEEPQDQILEEVPSDKTPEQIKPQEILEDTIEPVPAPIENIEPKPSLTSMDVPPMPTPDFESQSNDPAILALQMAEKLSLEYDRKYIKLMKFKKTNLITRLFKQITKRENGSLLEREVEQAKIAYETAQRQYLKIVQSKK